LLIAAEIAGIVCVVGLYGLLRLFIRDVPPLHSSGMPYTTTATLAASELTAVFGVGAVVTALWLQNMGCCCLGAANLGANSTFVEQTGIAESDPRNPAVLIDTLSRQLGEILPRVLDAFVTSCLVSTLTLLLLDHPAATNNVLHSSSLATLPLVLRGFGLLASLFGFLTVRAAEHENLERAVLRSHFVAETVFASATVGTVLWLVGSWSVAITVAALLGVTFPAIVAYLRSLRYFHRLSRRTPTEGVYSEGYAQKAELLGEALKLVSLLPIAVYAVILLLAAFWQQRLASSDSLFVVAILIGLSSPSGLSSWHAAPSLALGIHSTAGLSGTLGRIPTTEEFSRRRRRLTAALEQLALRFDPVVTDGGIMLCALAALVIISWSGASSRGVLVPEMVAIALLAVLPVMVLIGDSVRNGARSALTQAGEVERQLRGLRRDGKLAQVPEDFVPSYRSCVELLARDASRGGLLSISLTVILPLLTALTGVRTENSPGSAATLLAMYLSVAAATGLAVMHAGHAAPLASSLANRYQMGRLPAKAESEARPSSFELVDFLRRSVAVSVPLLTKATTLVALAVAAMLS
jgi:Na+/H+-translocating membrane pyrophosphatase